MFLCLPSKIPLGETGNWDMEILYKIATVSVEFLIAKNNCELEGLFYFF